MQCSIQEYLNSLKDKNVAVLGIGISNLPLIHMLRKAGIRVTACDKRDRTAFGPQAEELEASGVCLRLGTDYLDHLEGQDVIFRTPGMRPDLPQLSAAVKRGSVLTSEMEVFFQVCPCPIIGITGSDGKTTTTTIIAELLKSGGYRVHLGGNIGNPLLPEAGDITPADYAVVELSSFQLMTMDLSPHIAVVTNLAPNHLDVHKSMEEYIAAKKNLFLRQRTGDRVILNTDNDITRSFVSEAKGAVTLFSRKEEPEGSAVFLRDNTIWVRDGEGERAVLSREGILLPGDHNVENYMAAIAAVNGLVKDETIRTFAASFGGVEHRIELVRTLNGVRYYNDSIASSPTRTIAGLRSFSEKVILIAGGYDKHIPFEALGPEVLKRVRRLILTGDTASKIRTAVESAPGFRESGLPIEEYDDFRQAVEAARDAASEGDVVILSPACASFDRFKNFMERGKAFKDIVQGF
ncbi:MAG: UDP-N-acetylmuramoyl-L-alanine--D-glutamate ligase [Oscillospiraceae bacterium]|nr:UDP-N-acetylmuramoyl-L-alanine--D-glutamate ligase [Oscillospiraceae bacterium]